MTEEERIVFMEQQRLAEEEMKKKKEDMLTQFLKVFLHVAVDAVLFLLYLSLDILISSG